MVAVVTCLCLMFIFFPDAFRISLGSEMSYAWLDRALLCFTIPFAQGCAMCYSNATGTTKEGQRAISRGVLVLLVPPVGFMTLGVGMALRYGKRRDEEQDSTND
jgi:hypothetical protein